MYFAEEAFPDVFIGSQNSTNDAWIEECFGKDVKCPLAGPSQRSATLPERKCACMTSCMYAGAKAPSWSPCHVLWRYDTNC